MILKVKEVIHYTESLFKIRVSRPPDFHFKAGQFTMIGLPSSDVQRAYSIASSPLSEDLEFYSIKVPSGEFTSKLSSICVGDELEVGGYPTGTLLPTSLCSGKHLWLLATGTGIAPFMSLIREGEIFSHYKEVELLWSVRYKEELSAYESELKASGVKFHPIVTRSPQSEYDSIRIDKQISSLLSTNSLNSEESRVMVCGNMDFNKAIREMLLSNNFKEGSRKQPGDFVLERAFVS